MDDKPTSPQDHKREQDAHAQYLLQSTALNTLDTTRLILELLHATDMDYDKKCDAESIIAHCRSIISEGAKLYFEEQHCINFHDAADEYLRIKHARRDRTITELRQCFQRIMRDAPEWRQRALCAITANDCHHVIYDTIENPCMRRKMIILLHSLFRFGIKRGYCQKNPILHIEFPPRCERKISTLNLSQIRKLIDHAQQPEHRCCAAALGLMLWAGLRPTEVTRIEWQHIDLKEKVITLEPQHSKTGGARQVTIYPILAHWLRLVSDPRVAQGRIIPPSWDRRWKKLRLAAGFQSWDCDCLRHSYASYHLVHFRNINELQLNMGHSDTELLRTRYLDLKGITKQAAAIFWGERS